MPKVTVIVPAYNAEPYLRECVDSIVNQSMQDIEIILINDGSTDGTGLILEEYKERYPFVKTIHQKNQGLYKARQNGLNLASGDYVGWVDADDYVDTAMFETLYTAAIQNDSELVYCDYSFFPKRGKFKQKWYRPYQGIRDTTFVELNSQPWNKIVKRELFQELEVSDKFETCFDEIYIKIMLMAKHPVSINKELYFYRMGQPTMSRSFQNVAHYERFIRASSALKKEMESWSIQDAYWKEYFEYREIYYMLQTMLIAANAKDKENFNRVKKELLSYPYPYRCNQHLKPIIDHNYGKLKSYVLRNLVPLNYSFTRIMCKAALGG